MADNLSDYLENNLLAHSVGQASFTAPTTTYCGLFVVTPSDVGGGTELYVQYGYQRQSITWGAPSGGTIANSADLRFPASSTATGPWSSVSGGSTTQAIVAIGIFDALTSGNLLWYGPLSANVTVASGDDFKIVAGGLTLSLS